MKIETIAKVYIYPDSDYCFKVLCVSSLPLHQSVHWEQLLRIHLNAEKIANLRRLCFTTNSEQFIWWGLICIIREMNIGVVSLLKVVFGFAVIRQFLMFEGAEYVIFTSSCLSWHLGEAVRLLFISTYSFYLLFLSLMLSRSFSFCCLFFCVLKDFFKESLPSFFLSLFCLSYIFLSLLSTSPSVCFTNMITHDTVHIHIRPQSLIAFIELLIWHTNLYGNHMHCRYVSLCKWIMY